MPLSDKEKDVAIRLKSFRETLKIKQKEVSLHIETRQGQLSEMENGIKQIQPRVIFYLAERYGLNVDWLFTGRGEKVVNSISEVNEPGINYGGTEERLKRLEAQVHELLALEKRIRWLEGEGDL